MAAISVACGDTATKEAPPAATPPPAPQPVSASASNTPIEAVTASARASERAPLTPAEPSPEPGFSEWLGAPKSPEALVGAEGTGCEATRVREWVRIQCSMIGRKTEYGTPMGIEVLKLSGSKPSAGSVLWVKEGAGHEKIVLIHRFAPGTSLEAVFEFSREFFRYRSAWPNDGTPTNAVGSFEKTARDENYASCLLECAAGVDGEPFGPSCRQACVTERAASARPSVDTAMALPAEPALEGAPSLDAWKNAREVNVKGSDAHGCETKQAGEWIRIVCRPTERYGKLLDGSWIQGTDAISSYAVAGGGAVVLLLLRYVEGVDASAALGFEKSRAKLRINWPKGMALPQVRGQIDDLP